MTPTFGIVFYLLLLTLFFLTLFVLVLLFSFLMDTYSSAQSSKPCYTHRAYVLNELKEAKKALAQKDEELQRLEARLTKIELQQEGVVHSLHETTFS